MGLPLGTRYMRCDWCGVDMGSRNGRRLRGVRAIGGGEGLRAMGAGRGAGDRG